MSAYNALDNDNNDDILVQTEFVTLANGHRIPQTSPSPLLLQLQQACQTGSLPETEQILGKITPLPVGPIPVKAHVALQECLRTAVAEHHRDVVRALLQRPGGLLSSNLSGLGVNTAFHAHDTATLKVFIDCGWDVNESGREADSMRPLLRHALDDADLRTFLLAHGASPNVADIRGVTALETAVQFSELDVVRELLQHGGDPSTDDSLILAAELGRLDVAELLLKNGADVNASLKTLPQPFNQRSQKTALKAAMEGDHHHMVQWLKAHGATAGCG